MIYVGMVVWSIALSLFVSWLWKRREKKYFQQLTEMVGARGAGWEQAEQRAKLHERRASEFFGIIEGVERERDTWQQLYRQSSYHAGVAQAWLLRDLSSAVQIANGYAGRLKKHGEAAKTVAVDPRLNQVLADFGAAHAEGGEAAKVAHAPGLAVLESPAGLPPGGPAEVLP